RWERVGGEEQEREPGREPDLWAVEPALGVEAEAEREAARDEAAEQHARRGEDSVGDGLRGPAAREHAPLDRVDLTIREVVRQDDEREEEERQRHAGGEADEVEAS